jgi:hypothetical protein
MSEAYTGVGTLSDSKTVILDNPTLLPPGRVRVIVELLPENQPKTAWLETLDDIHRTLLESGYQPRTRNEIDKQLASERDAWDG